MRYLISLMMRCCCALLLLPLTLSAQDYPASWLERIEPFHIVGPIYYVGSGDLSSYLLVDPEGLMLVNVGMDENVDGVLDNIQQLGHDPQQLRYILITQAHFDHGGGAARLQRLTGAQVLAGAADASLLHAGGRDDYVFANKLTYAAVPEARAVSDGDVIQLGQLRLETIATPGHTAGSSSWLLRFSLPGMRVREMNALFAASVSVLAQTQLVDNPLYPQVVTDYRRTYARLRALSYDYYLPDHLVFVRGEPEEAPRAEWFQRVDALPAWIEQSEHRLQQLLTKQRAAPVRPD